MTQSPPKKTQPCSVCGFQNRVGVLICENCGTQFVAGWRSVVDTRNFADQIAEIAKNKPAPAPEPVKPAVASAPEPAKPVDAPAPPHKCPTCKKDNPIEAKVCENCGTNLLTGEPPKNTTGHFNLQQAISTLVPQLPAKTERPKPSTLSTEEINAVRSAGAAVFEEHMILRLEIEGAPTPLLVMPKASTMIGRRDPVTNTTPEVDMTAYAGYRMGVSRQHAILRLHSKVLDILDLGSSNGTYVNGVRLSPHQPHSLRDGDEVTLGKMNLKVYFQSGKR